MSISFFIYQSTDFFQSCSLSFILWFYHSFSLSAWHKQRKVKERHFWLKILSLLKIPTPKNYFLVCWISKFSDGIFKANFGKELQPTLATGPVIKTILGCKSRKFWKFLSTIFLILNYKRVIKSRVKNCLKSSIISYFTIFDSSSCPKKDFYTKSLI